MSDVRHPFHFRSGLSLGPSGYEVIAVLDVSREIGGYASEILRFDQYEGFSGFSVPWVVTRLARHHSVPDRLFGTGPAGLVFLREAGILSERAIDESDQGPRLLGDIRELRFIGDVLYAAGMSRQVYYRSESGWQHNDRDLITSAGTFQITGFNALCGADKSLIYAVGFGGEIWRGSYGRWVPLASPTNLVLTRIESCDTETAIACGQAGLVLRIRGERVDVIDQDITERDFWGLAVLGGDLYAASDMAVFRIEPSKSFSLTEVLTGCSCGHLHVSNGVMYSFGERHIMRSLDGTKWEDVTPDESRL